MKLKDVAESFRLQHVESGLFLDAEVKYAFMERGEPWEHAGSELALKARDDYCPDRQRWVFDENFGLIRHYVDGRALDANFKKLKIANGVDINVPCGAQTWSIYTLQQAKEPAAYFSVVSFEPSIPIAPVGENTEFFIAPAAANLTFCVSVHEDGCVNLATLDGSAVKKWGLVDGDKF